jgi:hypothetical protein
MTGAGGIDMKTTITAENLEKRLVTIRRTQKEISSYAAVAVNISVLELVP